MKKIKKGTKFIVPENIPVVIDGILLSNASWISGQKLEIEYVNSSETVIRTIEGYQFLSKDIYNNIL